MRLGAVTERDLTSGAGNDALGGCALEVWAKAKTVVAPAQSSAADCSNAIKLSKRHLNPTFTLWFENLKANHLDCTKKDQAPALIATLLRTKHSTATIPFAQLPFQDFHKAEWIGCFSAAIAEKKYNFATSELLDKIAKLDNVNQDNAKISTLEEIEKEIEETLYWLELCNFSESYPNAGVLIEQINTISRIVNKIIITSKQK